MSQDDLRRRMLERKLAELNKEKVKPEGAGAPVPADRIDAMRRRRLVQQRQEATGKDEDPNALVSDETAAKLKAAADLASKVGKGGLALSRGVAQAVVDKTREVRAEHAARPKSEGGKKLPWLIGGVVALALVGGGAWWWTSRGEEPAVAKSTVPVMPVMPVAAPVYTPPAKTEEPTPEPLPAIERASPIEEPAQPNLEQPPAPAKEVMPEPLFVPAPTAQATKPTPAKPAPEVVVKPVARVRREAPKPVAVATKDARPDAARTAEIARKEAEMEAWFNRRQAQD